MGELTDATTVATAGNVINNSVTQAAHVLGVLVDAAKASPIIAIAVSLITVDLLENQLKILHPRTATEIKLAIAALVGAEVVSDIAGAIESGFSLLTGGGTDKGKDLLMAPYQGDTRTSTPVQGQGPLAATIAGALKAVPELGAAA